jgi:hypothetical protein
MILEPHASKTPVLRVEIDSQPSILRNRNGGLDTEQFSMVITYQMVHQPSQREVSRESSRQSRVVLARRPVVVAKRTK